MPFNPVPPRYTQVFSAALRDASALVGETICRATGRDFQDLPTPPPLSLVARAYRDVMLFHMAATAQAHEAAKAEQEANERGGHAAEILSPAGEHLGYTIYTESKPDLNV